MRPVSLILVMFIFIMTVLSGCATSSSSTPPPPTQSNASIRAVIAGITDEWSLSMGCYTIVTGYAYNTGSSSVNPVVVYLTLVYPDGTIRDSSVVYLGSIPPLESGNFQVILDRECGDDYTIRVTGTP